MHLTITEKFLLLAHHPEKGRFLTADLQLNHAMTGLQFLELSYEEAFSLDPKERLVLRDDYASNDPMKAELVERIRKSRRKYKIRDWIIRLSPRMARKRSEVLQGMQEKGILRIEPRKFLWLIPYKKTFLEQVMLRKSLIDVLRISVLEGKELNQEMVALLGLIQACRLEKLLTADKAELKLLQQKLKLLIKESPYAEAVDKSIRQVQAAIMASIAASTAAAGAAASSR